MNCIYKIYSTLHNDDNSYIGYCRNFKSRVSFHKTCLKYRTRMNCKLYQYMEKVGLENFKFQILVQLPIYDREQLRELERFYYELYQPSLNIKYPKRTIKEYNETFKGHFTNLRLNNREEHNKYVKKRNSEDKEVIRARALLYYQKNKDKVNKNNNSICTCTCGCQIKHYTKKKHRNSTEHKNKLKEVILRSYYKVRVQNELKRKTRLYIGN